MSSLQSQQEQKSHTEPLGGLSNLLRPAGLATGNVALFVCVALEAKETVPRVWGTLCFTVVNSVAVTAFARVALFPHSAVKRRANRR